MAMPLPFSKIQKPFLPIFVGCGNRHRRRDLTPGTAFKGWFSPDMQTMKDLFLHSMLAAAVGIPAV
jgi:hypothetical protein